MTGITDATHDPFTLENRGTERVEPTILTGGRAVPLGCLAVGASVRAIYRVGRCLNGWSRNGAEYRFVELLDGASKLPCFGWTLDLVNALPAREGAMVEVSFVTFDLGGNMRGRLTGMRLLPNPASEDVIATLPASLCPIPGVVEGFRKAVAAIREPLLREFVARVFQDYAFAKRYFSVPASVDDHHARRGGQAEHAVEMALDAAIVESVSPLNRDLSIVLALFHDVGKVETHEATPQATAMRRMVWHDALTLYLVAGPLQWLYEHWPEGARALMVGWVPAKARQLPGEQPVIFPPQELVRGLDRTSRASDMQRVHAPDDGGLIELSRHRATWSPAPPPSTDSGIASASCQPATGCASQ